MPASNPPVLMRGRAWINRPMRITRRWTEGTAVYTTYEPVETVDEQ